MAITNDAGKRLSDYPRPSVAVDTAVLTVSGDELCILVVAHYKAPGYDWALPGTFLHEGERLADAVLRSLREKAHVSGRQPKQLHVFDEPRRDPRGWVLSVAHVDVVPLEELEQALATDGVKLLPVAARVPDLPYDHPAIIAKAMERARAAYRSEPDPGGLLTGAFTLRDLRMVHQAVMGEELQRDTFRRLMEPQLVPTGEMTDGARGRPSRLFRRPR
ncbi:NUDIX hydrolase [Arthrobacter crystallopoietes BAB-32]|uniref:NUDIX hydrolase n=1 Tax=Arthrobacter crystallopoietes BAB-32 TaxID=1246476 RepID=N1V5X1_9MICC|nr:NUDIX domain-containing protein [Arthrobacter crystallopoietes]EMY35399.1 NUDIX hydrolase [Arthrobacter crystallopoietes BAB-32]